MISSYIKPDWPAPDNICAFVTTHAHGNLAAHVGDDPQRVARHRQQLYADLQLPNEPIWLTQVHGTEVICADAMPNTNEIIADASYATVPNVVCAVLTADCLPVLLCDVSGTKVAALHCGWRSLSDGIIEQTIQALDLPGEQLLAWLGPAIGPEAFEVGKDVFDAFVIHDANAQLAFKQQDQTRWLADIYSLAKQRLVACKVLNIYGAGFCTYTESERFFSYRREAEQAGRMASLIWRSDDCISTH